MRRPPACLSHRRIDHPSRRPSFGLESGRSYVSGPMSHSDDDIFTDDLQQVADVLRDGRPTLDPLALDRVKLRAMSGARRSTTPRHKGLFMRSRLMTLVTAVFLILGTGGAMALAGGGHFGGFDGFGGFGGGDGGSASYHQYRPPCPPGYEFAGDRHCRPIPPPRCGHGFEFSGGKCIPTPPPT